MKGHCPICLPTLPWVLSMVRPSPAKAALPCPRQGAGRAAEEGERTPAGAVGCGRWRTPPGRPNRKCTGLSQIGESRSLRGGFPIGLPSNTNQKLVQTQRSREPTLHFTRWPFFLGRIANEGATIYPRIESEQHGGFPAPAG